MKKYNYQDWLKAQISDDPEVILAGKLEYLRLYLTDAMRQVRKNAGLTQAQLAEKLGVQQAAVSKLESALKDREFESVLHYLYALDADLLVAVKQGEELYQASDNEGVLLVDVPAEVKDLASKEKMSLREYVRAAIAAFSPKFTEVIKSGIAFLESDDPVAVQVREVLGNRSSRPLQKTNSLTGETPIPQEILQKSIEEVVVELERLYQNCPKDEWRYAGGEVLAGSVATGGFSREESDEDAEIELQDLAESLLEKLAEIWLKFE